MEKVVTVYAHNYLGKFDMSDVNECLRNGWKVKTIHTVVVDNYINAIFVLEK